MSKFLRFVLYLVPVFFSCKYEPAVSAVFFNGQRLTALNENARIGVVKGRDRNAFFIFSGEQSDYIKRYSNENGGASLKITLSIEDQKDSVKKTEILFGFLYDEDFDDDETIIKNREGRIFSRFVLDKNLKSARVSLVLPEKTPKGFALTCTGQVCITTCDLCPAATGWSKDCGGLFYFAGLEGYDINQDFSKCPFYKSYNKDAFNVALKVQLFDAEFLKGGSGTYDAQNRTELSIGNENFSIRAAEKNDAKIIHEAALKECFSDITFTKNAEAVKSVFFIFENQEEVNEALPSSPIKTDLGLILDWPRSKWRCRDYELFEWELFPGVLIFDFADYNVQNEYLTRLAFFAEKTGYKGTLVDDDFVRYEHGYNAHDYKARDLAAFFTLASSMRFKLNGRELHLKSILLKNGIIVEEKNGLYKEGSGCIISISRESPSSLRERFIAHESWHGIFFTDGDFRNFVANLYENFDPSSMDFIQTYWQYANGLGYDRNDSYLMKNEFMAYIMQQSLARCASYFTELTNRNAVRTYCPRLGEYIRQNKAVHFADAAQKLNSYAFKRWGLCAGRVHLISRSEAAR